MKVTIRNKKGLICFHYTHVIRVVCAKDKDLTLYFEDNQITLTKEDYGWYEIEVDN